MPFSLAQLLIGLVAAILIGFSKTGLPGVGMLVVTMMAMIFPAKQSVGAVLPLLIAGDVFAVFYYHRHAQWRHLVSLFPFVFLGMIPAAFVLSKVTSAQLAPGLGWLILALLGLELCRTRFGLTNVPHQLWFVALMGGLAGFATTVGNVAGPVMALYLNSRDLPKNEFMGTGAWYYMLVNTAKIPVFLGLGLIAKDAMKFGLMINGQTALFDLIVAPGVVAGALLGVKILPRVSQKLFTSLVLLLAAAAAVRLVLS